MRLHISPLFPPSPPLLHLLCQLHVAKFNPEKQIKAIITALLAQVCKLFEDFFHSDTYPLLNWAFIVTLLVILLALGCFFYRHKGA